ncbi:MULTISPECIES: hypothetical protein [unclassified Mycobacteroides]|uniref:hypothetical protein n=1 Tax=unclassified Mycobacteroides TaxID=2618759 RepID=UPI0012DE4D5E|nr:MULTISPECIES: hypothetical protein [unclassified Mycobacteroides]
MRPPRWRHATDVTTVFLTAKVKGITMRDIAVEIVVEDDEIVSATEMVASH